MSVLYCFSFCTKNGQWPDNSILAESFWKAIVFQYSFLMKIQQQYICHVLENGDDYVEINGLLIVNFQELVPSRPSLPLSKNDQRISSYTISENEILQPLSFP